MNGETGHPGRPRPCPSLMSPSRVTEILPSKSSIRSETESPHCGVQDFYAPFVSIMGESVTSKWDPDGAVRPSRGEGDTADTGPFGSADRPRAPAQMSLSGEN